MTKILHSAGIVLFAAVATLPAYEWEPHNYMALHARELAERVETSPELAAFLQEYGPSSIDTRAGDPSKNAFTDEDHNEGLLSGLMWCTYHERDCYQSNAWFNSEVWIIPCTLDHFHERLPWPSPNYDAIDHARRYLDLATRLYKAAKCEGNAELASSYRQGAARALGHVLHLVEDMGSPVHTRPENHAPFPWGHGPSFHEYWTLDSWLRTRLYTSPDGTRSWTLAGFDAAAKAAATPRQGVLEGIMGSLAAESRQLPATSPHPPGSSLLLTELLRVMNGRDLQPQPGASS